MIQNSPEYLVDEVRNRYGIEVPIETAITYLDNDPNLTPDSLYDYVLRYSNEPNEEIYKIKGYKFVELSKDKIPFQKGVYIWLLKEDACIPEINNCKPLFKRVEINKTTYRVLYVGQAKKESLFHRIQIHLKGNPRHSTLCWSLSAVMGMPYSIVEESHSRGKPKMDGEYCIKMSEWLLENCYLLYKVCDDVDSEEVKQICRFMPPINIDKNPIKNTDPFIITLKQNRYKDGGGQNLKSSPSSISWFAPFIFIAIILFVFFCFAILL